MVSILQKMPKPSSPSYSSLWLIEPNFRRYYVKQRYSISPIYYRSVRIEGQVEKVTAEVSKAYFESRPIGSQIGAAVSHQSQVIPNRGHLLEKEAELKVQRFELI